MKKHISIILIMTLLLTFVFSFGSVALADSEFSVSPDESNKEATEGDNFRFTFYVKNSSDSNMDGPIICTTTGDTVVDSFSVAANSENGGDFPMDVSTELLGQTLTFTYNGMEYSTQIAKKELKTEIAGTATAPYTLYGEGETVKFTFTIENHGETTLNDIVITAPELNGGQALNGGFSLEPRAIQTVTYSHTMANSITVNPSVSYTVDSAAQTPLALDPVTITLESRYVKPTLTASNTSPEEGEDVTFTLTLVNEGNVPYTDITVLANGEEQDFPSSLKAGDTISGDFTMSFQTSTDVSCSISLIDHTDQKRNITSNTVAIDLPVDSDALDSKLDFTMSVDRPQLTSAGTINFTGLITNGTDYDLSNISVTEETLGTIYSADSLTSGSTANVPFETDINETTTYSFVLTATDKDGNTYTKTADPITVTIQSVAVEETPSYEDAAEITETPLTLDKNVGLGSIGTLGIIAIVLVVLIIGVGVALFIIWKKGKGPKKTTPPGRRKPAASTVRKKPSAPKNYHDRNNF